MIIPRQNLYSLRNNKKLGQAWYNIKSGAIGAAIGAGIGGAGIGALTFGKKEGILAGAASGSVLGGMAGVMLAPKYRTPEEKAKFNTLIDSVSWVGDEFDRMSSTINKLNKELGDKHPDCYVLVDYLYIPIPFYYPRLNSFGEKEDETKIFLGKIEGKGEGENCYIYGNDLNIYLDATIGKVITEERKVVNSKSELRKLLKSCYNPIPPNSVDLIIEHIFSSEADMNDFGITKEMVKSYIIDFNRKIQQI